MRTNLIRASSPTPLRKALFTTYRQVSRRNLWKTVQVFVSMRWRPDRYGPHSFRVPSPTTPSLERKIRRWDARHNLQKLLPFMFSWPHQVPPTSLELPLLPLAERSLYKLVNVCDS